MSESQPPAGDPGAPPEATDAGTPATPGENPLPPGYVHDAITGQPRPMTFMEKARQAAGAAAVAAAKVSVEVGSQAAKVGAEVGSQAAKAGADLGSKAAHQAATTIRDPATKARARSALKKAKHGFTTALERIDPKILADVVVKATSLQEKANASLQNRGSVYRIGEITIGASFPPSIQFSIERVDDPDNRLHDSSTLLAKDPTVGDAEATIVGLDGTAVDEVALTEIVEEEEP